MAFSFFNANTDPLEHFDYEYVDRLFIENRLVDWIGKHKNDGTEFKSLSDFFQPNYLKTQLKAFFWGLDNIPDEINFSWLAQIHHLAVDGLHHESGNPIAKRIRQNHIYLGFPNSLMQMAIGASDKASPSGIESLHDELKGLNDEGSNEKIIFFIREERLNIQESKGLATDFQTAKKYYEMQEDVFEKNKDFFIDLLESFNTADIFANGMNLQKINQDMILNAMKEVISAGYLFLLNGVGYYLLDKNTFQIRAKAEKLIQKYNQALKNTDDEKIDCIVAFVKGLLNLHVWSDGNGRVCAHHLLNLLLRKNKLYPTMLTNNCLDAFDKIELRERVKAGMAQYKLYCRKEEKTLEAFRLQSGLAIVKEAEFIRAILNNQIQKAEAYFKQDKVLLTDKDLFFYATCLHAKIDWILPMFAKTDIISVENNQYTLSQLIHVLIPLTINEGNENLLCNILNHCIDNQIEISISLVEDIVIFGNYHVYQTIKPILDQLNINNKTEKFCTWLLHCRDEKVALEMMNHYLSQLTHQPFSTDNLLAAFKMQSAPVLIKLVGNKLLNNYLNTILPGWDRKELLEKIGNRDDLTVVEKNQILKAINPIFTYLERDPLDDFPTFKLEKKNTS